MKNGLKIFLFLATCMMLCSCPGSSFIMYKLIGDNSDSYREYYDVVNGNDTIRTKVGVMHSFVERKTYLIVRMETSKEHNFKVFSTAYGELSLQSEKPYVFNKELQSVKKKDTIIIENEGKRYYFAR